MPNNSERISLTCPYCGNSVETSKPGLEQKPAIRILREVMSVPYTRDVGRFDPKNEEERTSANKWSRIGSDYLHQIKFEKFGILRIPDNFTVDVRYRVQYCDNCCELFDVYLNYSDHNLSEIWPELFPPIKSTNKPTNIREEDTGLHEDNFALYQKESWSVYLVRKIGKFFHSNTLGIIVIGLVLLIVGLFPWIISGRPAALNENPAFFLFCLVLFCVSVVFVVVSLSVFENYLSNGIQLDELLRSYDVKLKNRMIHWFNYTFCRYVGVQRKPERPTLSQVDIYTGGMSVGSVILVWAITKHGWDSLLFIAGAIILFGGYIFLINKKVEKPINRKRLVVMPLITGFIVSGFIISRMSVEQRWYTIFDISSLFFWASIAYFIGSAALLALNTAFYVIKGMSNIPIRFPLARIEEALVPMVKVKKFSNTMMDLVFIFSISLMSLLLALEQTTLFPNLQAAMLHFEWLILWLRWILVLIFGAISISARDKVTGILIAVYIPIAIVTLLFASTQFVIFNSFVIDWSLLVFGVFLTALRVYHKYVINSSIKKRIDKSTGKFLEQTNQRIFELKQQLGLMKGKPDDLGKHLLLIQTLNEELKIGQNVTSEKRADKNSLLLSVIVSPALWSLILPSLWNEVFGDSISRLMEPIKMFMEK